MEANKTTLITKIKELYKNPLLIKDSSFIENILHNIIPYIDDEGLTNILKNDPKPINGISFLEFLAQTDYTSEMKEILSRIKSHPDDIRNIADATLLSSAALNGNDNMMKVLIDLGANIDSKEKGNYTPFILRILSGPISTECLNFYMGKIENLSTMIGTIQELSERCKQKMLPEHISRQLIINLIAFTRKNFEYFENDKKIVMVRYPNKGDNWRLGGFERNPIDYKKLLDEIELDNMYGEYHEQELTPICRTPKVILPQKLMFKKQMTTLENNLPKASFVKMKQGFSDLDKKPIIKTTIKKPQFKKLPLNVKVNLGLQQEL